MPKPLVLDHGCALQIREATTPRNSDLIDLGWVSGKLSDDSKDYYSEVHWLVYIDQAIFSVTHQTPSQSQSLFHSSFKPSVFASDSQITANAICQLPETSVSKLSLFLTALFPDHGRKATPAQGAVQKELLLLFP